MCYGDDDYDPIFPWEIDEPIQTGYGPDNYPGKLSQRKIARRLDIGKTTINNWAAELGFNHKRH